MRSKERNASYFDDDFEVTYEDETTFDYNTAKIDFETQDIDYRSRSNRPDHRDFSNYTDDGYEDDSDYAYDEDYYDENDYSSNSANHAGNRKRQRRSERQKRYRPTRLAAPIQKGGNAVFRISRSIIRNLTLILMLAILILLGYNFFRGSAPYGDIENAVSTNTYTQMIAAYFSVASVIILYEIISMLWAMTKVRVRDQYGVYREDVGRGLFSFIFLYVCSYAAFFVNNWIPESIDVLKGIKGALDVFGSMHNALFGLCLAGVVSCLFRKYSLSL